MAEESANYIRVRISEMLPAERCGVVAWAGINHGGTEGTSPRRIWSGDTNANCPTRFCHVSKFQPPDCLHYNAVKSLPTT